MKIFISSLIGGFEEFRRAARESVIQLGHEPIMAEDFPAQPSSPQVACLSGLRQSSLMLLLIGERYGQLGQSGISPTHEEYRDAKGRVPVIAFVQEGVVREPAEQTFAQEVQGWEAGLYRGGFGSPEQLKGMITRAIHEWQLANAVAPLNATEVLERALAQLDGRDQSRHYYRSGQMLVVSLAFGPYQTILRPAEIENPRLADTLIQAALFGPARIFDRALGTNAHPEGEALKITQGEGHPSFQIGPTGDMLFKIPLGSEGFGPIIIHEKVQAAFVAVMTFANTILDQIDSTQRLTHVVPAATFSGSDHLVWRTQAEQDKSPNSYSMGGWNGDQAKTPATLTPPAKPRAALSMDGGHMVEDLVVILRRKWKGQA